MVLSKLEFIISRIVVYQWQCQANNVLSAPYIVSQIYIDPLYKRQGFLIWGMSLFISIGRNGNVDIETEYLICYLENVINVMNKCKYLCYYSFIKRLTVIKLAGY